MSSGFLIDVALVILWLTSYFSGTDKLKLIFEIVLFLFIRDAFKKEKERLKNDVKTN